MAKDVKKAPSHRVRFIFGEEDYRRDAEIDRISSDLMSSEVSETISINAPDAGVVSALAEAMTGSLFHSVRHVVIRNAEELKQADAKKLIESLVIGDECPLPEGTYVSVSWAERKFPPAGVKIPKKAPWVCLVECKKAYEREAREFVRSYAKEIGLELAQDAMDALLQRLGTDLSLVASEIDKLVTYLGPGVKRATGEDVRKAVGEAQHENISDLNSAIVAGNSSHAMHLVRQFRDSTEPRIPNQLMLASVASELRLMLSIQEKLSEGKKTFETVKEIKSERQLRTPDFILERTVNSARKLGPGRAARMLVRLGEADRQMKGGTGLSDTSIGEDQAFDSAVLDLCSLAKD